MKRFPSVKKSSEFQVMCRNGTPYANRLLMIYVMKTGEGGSRIGISMSKKAGDSVARYRITRLLRGIFHLSNYRIKTRLNIILVVRGAVR